VAGSTIHEAPHYNPHCPHVTAVLLCGNIIFSAIMSAFVFRHVRKIAKNDCMLRHVRLSVRPSAWDNNSVTDGQIFMKLIFGGYQRYVKRINFLTKSDKNNGHFTQWPMRIYDTVSMDPS